jgi:hypothetical protein
MNYLRSLLNGKQSGWLEMTKKALPRKSRSYPQSARCFSTNFPLNMENSGVKCYVPLTDFQVLAKKFTKLFKRYQREVQHVKKS